MDFKTITQQLGFTTYLMYGAGGFQADKRTPNISALSMFKLFRYFQDNYRMTKESGGVEKFAFSPNGNGFNLDLHLQMTKAEGIKNIWCTQGGFYSQNIQTNKLGKVCPINDEDDQEDPASWSKHAELCKQIAIRYAKDTKDKISEVDVYDLGPTSWHNTVPYAGLGTLDAIEILNEWNFKKEWSGAARDITPEGYAAAFYSAYKAIRSVSKEIEIIMGGPISITEELFTRFLTRLKQLFESNGEVMPNDFYLCFHWYMRKKAQDQEQIVGDTGASPEEANALSWGHFMDNLCQEYNLPGWYCTETGWSAIDHIDDSVQACPIQEGFTQIESQALLIQRLALIWGSCKYYQGTSFWHCADNYDTGGYRYGGVNYRNYNNVPDWTPKKSRLMLEEFKDKYGAYWVEKYYIDNDIHIATLRNTNDDVVNLRWSDLNNIDDVTPMPTEFIPDDGSTPVEPTPPEDMIIDVETDSTITIGGVEYQLIKQSMYLKKK